jgi:hypothetical protein
VVGDVSTFDGTPRTRQEVSTVVYRDVSDSTRRALLNRHTRITLDRCLRILAEPLSHEAGQEAALEVLVEAAPKYERLGGDLHPWKEE